MLKSLLELKKSSNCLYIIFSNTLAIEGKTEMGLLLFRTSLSPFLKRGDTLPILNYPNFFFKLKNN